MVAKAKEQAFTRGTKIKIYDTNEILIGSVEEVVFKSMFKSSTSYEIKDSNGLIIAISNKSDQMTTKFTFTSNGKEIAKFHRGLFNTF